MTTKNPDDFVCEKVDEEVQPEQKRSYPVTATVSALNTLSDNNTIVVLDLPKCLKLQPINRCNTERDISLDVLELKVKNFTIPSINLENQKIPFQTGSYTAPLEKIGDFESLTVSFEMDSEMLNYYTLYQWVNMIVDIENGAETRFCKSDYQTKFHAFILNQKRCPVASFVFHNVVPQILGGFETDSTSGGNAVFVDFTFDYDYTTFNLRNEDNLI